MLLLIAAPTRPTASRPPKTLAVSPACAGTLPKASVATKKPPRMRFIDVLLNLNYVDSCCEVAILSYQTSTRRDCIINYTSRHDCRAGAHGPLGTADNMDMADMRPQDNTAAELLVVPQPADTPGNQEPSASCNFARNVLRRCLLQILLRQEPQLPRPF